MTEYGWEVAEILSKGIKSDDIEDVASVLDYLDEKSDLNEEDEVMLYITREYASEEGYEGVKEWSEEILTSQSSFPDSLKPAIVAISGFLLSNAGYDYIFNQEVDPGTFAGGIPEIGATFASASGIFAGYHLLNSDDPDEYFEEIEENLEERFSESNIPELDEIYSTYNN